MKEPIAAAGASPFSPGIRAGGHIYLAGQGGFDEHGELVDGGMAAETRQAFRNVERLLAAAGATLDDVVACAVHLTDLADIATLNEIWKETFTGVRPVRTTVRADLLNGMHVEITATAVTE